LHDHWSSSAVHVIEANLFHSCLIAWSVLSVYLPLFMRHPVQVHTWWYINSVALDIIDIISLSNHHLTVRNHDFMSHSLK